MIAKTRLHDLSRHDGLAKTLLTIFTNSKSKYNAPSRRALCHLALLGTPLSLLTLLEHCICLLNPLCAALFAADTAVDFGDRLRWSDACATADRQASQYVAVYVVLVFEASCENRVFFR
ncbi:hypothetical protein MKX08_002756 [Trichoderma sp. CBMAI-0020]|nr:hypothetical protein MKX08_002756 [Trichoderma sp. CBMAI-0020]